MLLALVPGENVCSNYINYVLTYSSLDLSFFGKAFPLKNTSFIEDFPFVIKCGGKEKLSNDVIIVHGERLNQVSKDDITSEQLPEVFLQRRLFFQLKWS